MSNKININGFYLSRTQFGITEYRISVFSSYKYEFQFDVSLQPTGKDDVLPTYQLSDKSQKNPDWTFRNLEIISDWLIKNPIIEPLK